MNDIKVSDVTTMSTLEIATLTGKRHNHILVDARNMLNELNIDSPENSAQYKDSSGRSLTLYNLNKELTLTLISGYNIKLRNAIIKRWHELEGEQKPLTPAEQILVSAQFMLEQEKINSQIPILTDKFTVLREDVDRIQSKELSCYVNDVVSIKAYCKIHKVRLTTPQSAVIGKACKKRCKEEVIALTETPDRKYGVVRTYPAWVIEEVLTYNGFITN